MNNTQTAAKTSKIKQQHPPATDAAEETNQTNDTRTASERERPRRAGKIGDRQNEYKNTKDEGRKQNRRK